MLEILTHYWWLVVVIAVGFAAVLWWTSVARKNGSSEDATVLDPNRISDGGDALSSPAIDNPEVKAAASFATFGDDGLGTISGTTAALAPESDAPVSKPAIAHAVGAPDNLQLMKGVGPKLAAICQSLGVLRFDQIAHWSAGDIAEVDQHLGAFRGRIVRDQWVDQARLLASNDMTAFELKYGKLERAPQ